MQDDADAGRNEQERKELQDAASRLAEILSRFASSPEQPAEQQGHADDSAGQGKGGQINQNFTGQQKGQELQKTDQHATAPSG